MYILFLLQRHFAFSFIFFFFNDTATTEIYTLSLHDALPILIFLGVSLPVVYHAYQGARAVEEKMLWSAAAMRSEEHTSELQSRENLVCRLLLEKKKKKIKI